MATESDVSESSDSTFVDGWLRLHGRQDWTSVRQLLQGSTCAYADYDGFHIGDAPVDPPPYSHLWAWATDRFWRVRVDESDALVSSLTVQAPDESGDEMVRVKRVSALTWKPKEGRIGRQDAAVLPGENARMIMWQTVEDQPIVFISAPDEL